MTRAVPRNVQMPFPGHRNMREVMEAEYDALAWQRVKAKSNMIKRAVIEQRELGHTHKKISELSDMPVIEVKKILKDSGYGHLKARLFKWRPA